MLSGGGMHAHRRVGSKIASAATQGVESLLDRAFDKRTWQMYCALYAVRSTTVRDCDLCASAMRFRGGAEQCLCRLVLPHRHLSTRITALLFVHLILIFYLILYLFGLRDRYAYAREKSIARCKAKRGVARIESA